MRLHELSLQFASLVEAAGDADELGRVLRAITRDLGFQYFAVTHHVDVLALDLQTSQPTLLGSGDITLPFLTLPLV